MKRFTTIKEYPAYDVVTFNEGVEPKVYDGETLTDEKHLENWRLGSVVSYAIENGEDPIEEYNRALERGHQTHYAMALGAILKSHYEPKKPTDRRIMVKYGDVIIFHGQKFQIKKAPNNNINLIKID